MEFSYEESMTSWIKALLPFLTLCHPFETQSPGNDWLSLDHVTRRVERHKNAARSVGPVFP